MRPEPSKARTLNLPDFLCIGAQKAGTSWLNAVLGEHPQIFLPPIHELHFFDRGRTKPPRQRQVNLAKRALRVERGKGAEANGHYVDYLERLLSFSEISLDWYKAAYSLPVGDDVRKGDITPSYLDLSEIAVSRARKLLGPVKIIVILRRPADRLLSQMRMWAARNDRQDIPRNAADWMELFHEVSAKAPRGSYSEGIGRWHREFGEGAMLALPYGDMRTDPHGFIRRVEDHLGVKRFDSYKLIDERIHVSMKIEMDPAVIDAVTVATAAEADYIKREFGEEFFDRTR